MAAIQAATKNTEPRVTVEDIESYQPPNLTPYQQGIYQQVERLNSGLPALSNATYFPSAGSSINKGSYSGPTIGSVPIFAPDNLVPFGIYGARNEMRQQALMRKAKAIDDFFTLAKPPQTTRFSVQGELDQVYYKGLNQWVGELQNRYGSSWAEKANQDLEFQQWTESMRTIAKYNTGLVEKAAELQALDKDKNFVLSDNTKRAMNMVSSGISGLDDPFNPLGHNLGQYILQQEAESDLDMAVNSAIDQYVDQVYSSNPSQYSNGIYDVWTETKIHGMSEDQVKKIAEGIWVNSYGSSSDIFTKEMIEDRLRALYPKRAEKAVEFQTNQFSGADGSQITYDQSAVNNAPQMLTYTDSAGMPESIYTFGAQEIPRPIKLNTSAGTRFYNPDSNFESIQYPGNISVNIGKTFNVLVDANGRIVSQKDSRNIKPEDRKNYHYETFAAGTIDTGSMSETKTDPATGQSATSTQRTETTVWIPVSGIRNGLVSQVAPDGTVLKGVRIDIQKKMAEAATQKFHSEGQQQAAQSQQQPAPAQQQPAPAAPQRKYADDGRVLDASGKPKNQVVQGGVTYTWNPTTKQYE